MGQSVDLDRKACGDTIEIENIRIAGMLPAKLEAARAGAQYPPKTKFGRRHSAP